MNYSEYLADTDPRNDSQRLQPAVATSSLQKIVSFNVLANHSAMVETSTDLVNWPIWNALVNGGVPQPAA